jgi:hypothetical protein
MPWHAVALQVASPGSCDAAAVTIESDADYKKWTSDTKFMAAAEVGPVTIAWDKITNDQLEKLEARQSAEIAGIYTTMEEQRAFAQEQDIATTKHFSEMDAKIAAESQKCATLVSESNEHVAIKCISKQGLKSETELQVSASSVESTPVALSHTPSSLTVELSVHSTDRLGGNPSSHPLTRVERVVSSSFSTRRKS